MNTMLNHTVFILSILFTIFLGGCSTTKDKSAHALAAEPISSLVTSASAKVAATEVSAPRSTIPQKSHTAPQTTEPADKTSISPEMAKAMQLFY